MILTDFRKKVYECVRMIPKGRVSTYGQIALLIGSPRASRAVGNALHINPDPKHTPCFRVVNGEGFLSGAFAFGGPDEQRKQLERDGIRVKDNQVDLARYLWVPQILTSKKLRCPHAFSTRLGGVSGGIYHSLNLGIRTGDDEDNVRRNWEIFLRAAGIDSEGLVYGQQVHGSTVLTVTKDDLRPPCLPVPEQYRADGYVTDRSNVPLAVFTADCVPLLMEDRRAHVIAVVHCGWKSTAQDIERNAVAAMTALGAEPGRIRAAIGPAIEKECFETGEDVVRAMEELIGEEVAAGSIRKREQPGKYLVDLKGIVRERLLQLGLAGKNIDIIRACTMCEPGRFWSHRYTGGKRGSQVNIIMQ